MKDHRFSRSNPHNKQTTNVEVICENCRHKWLVKNVKEDCPNCTPKFYTHIIDGQLKVGPEKPDQEQHIKIENEGILDDLVYDYASYIKALKDWENGLEVPENVITRFENGTHIIKINNQDIILESIASGQLVEVEGKRIIRILQ